MNIEAIKERITEKTFFSPDGCHYWLGKVSKFGYGRIIINYRDTRVHRFVYELYKGNPGNMFVCHHCDNPLCINPDHLFLGTPRDNNEDALRKGRLKYCIPGQSSNTRGNSKLTKEQVIEIRSSQLSRKNISEKYGVSQAAISMLINGKTYQNT